MKRLMIIGPLAALAVTGCGGANDTSAVPASTTAAASKQATAKTSSGGAIPVDLTDFKIQPAATKIKAGKTEFKVTNTGKMPHEFVVIDTSKPAADLGKGSRVPEKGNIGETGNLKPGQSKVLVLNLKKGHYAVICNDPGHYMAGMHKDLLVS